MALNFLNDGYFAGKVGIGAPAASKKLEVTGNAQVEGTLTVKTASNNIRLLDINDSTVNFSVGVNGKFQIRDVSAVTNPFQIEKGAASNSLYIDSSGKVGIGTDDPIELLHLYGGVGNPTRIRLQADDGQDDVLTFHQSTTQKGAVGYDDSDDVVSLTYGGLSGTTGIKINSSGNVGIGTSSPSVQLDIEDSSNVIVDMNTTTANANTTIRLQESGTVKATIGYDGTNNGLILTTGGFTAGNGIFIDDTQKVGIGTASPTHLLTLETASSPGIKIKDTTQGATLLAFSQDSNSHLGTYSAHPLVLDTNSTERIRITSAGNVGIGTTSPGNTLHVYKNATIGVITSPTVANAGFRVQDSGANMYVDGNSFVIDTAGYLTTTGSNDFDIGTNSTSRIKIKGGGNVGIGTTNPTNKLHIQGSQATVYSSTDTGGQASAGTTINNTNTSGNTNNFSQLLFTVGTNNNSVSRIVAIRSGSDASDLAFVGKSTAGVAEYMRIKSGGNVGIGINNPSALLEVRKGSISGQIAKFSAINPHVVIESSTAGNAVLHLKPNATSSKSGQFKVTAGNGYNFRWSNDASGTAETAYMDLDTSTTGGGDLTVKGDVIAYGSPSDKKYKENIKPIESALDKAMQLQGVTFDWKDSESILEIKEDIGFIAQDVQEVLPELVRDNGKGNLSLRYQGITPILLEAIKELKAEIEELKLNNCNCNK